MKKILLFIFGFYFLILLQTSFFNFLRSPFNFVLTAFIVILYFQKERKIQGLFLALFCGFLLDIFSNFPFGTAVLTFVLIYLIFTVIMGFFFSANLFEAILFIILGSVLYAILIPLFGYLFGMMFNFYYPLRFSFSQSDLMGLAANLSFGLILFYILSRSQKLRKYIS